MDEMIAKENLPAGVVTLEKIIALQAEIGALPQFDFEVTHTHVGREYLRTLFMPAGSRVVGLRHRHNHPLIIAGHLAIAAPGSVAQEYVGYHVIDSKAGTKRGIVAISDSYLTTVHLLPREGMSMEEIEQYVIMPDEGEGGEE